MRQLLRELRNGCNVHRMPCCCSDHRRFTDQLPEVICILINFQKARNARTHQSSEASCSDCHDAALPSLLLNATAQPYIQFGIGKQAGDLGGYFKCGCSTTAHEDLLSTRVMHDTLLIELNREVMLAIEQHGIRTGIAKELDMLEAGHQRQDDRASTDRARQHLG